MIRGFKFTCKAASYQTAGGIVASKGWSINLAENDPRVASFRGNPAFTEERVEMSESAFAPAKEPKAQTDKPTRPENASAEDPISNVAELGPDLHLMLTEAGYETVGAALEAGGEKLQEIHGIGQKTADRIVACCQQYLGQ